MTRPKKIARYEIIRKLGKGGMGEVYLARDPNFVERQVAVKVLSDGLRDQPGFRARFEREANTLANLQHPAIVPVYDFGEEDNQLYLVMRHMNGGSLAAYLPMPLDRVDDTLTRLAAGLDKVHEKGIVHRDIKPANVLLDEDEQPYLADFGIAREVGKATTAVGTPRYMAPEQRGGEDVDASTDVYQLGVMLFEMLTGHLPKLDKASVHDYDSTLPLGCDQVITRATAEKKEDRYQSAGELAQAFSALVARRLAQEPGREDRRSPVGTVAPSWEEKTTKPRQVPNPDHKEPPTLRVQSISSTQVVDDGTVPLTLSHNRDPLAPIRHTSKRTLLISAIFAFIALGVILATIVMWFRSPFEAPLAVIDTFSPEVDIKRADERLDEAEHGLKLYQSDWVIAFDNAYAVLSITCASELLILSVPANQNMQIDCERVLQAEQNIIARFDPELFGSPKPVTSSENVKPAPTRTSRGTENQKPLLISPRNSVITDTHPTFRWQPVAGASGYRVTLTFSDPNRESWEVETTESSLSYPADQPALPLGSKILLKVVTLDDVNQVDRTTFSILDEQSQAELAEAEAQIRSLEVDETAHAYLLAQLYRQQEMKNAAIAQLEQITANPESVSADLWQQLGDLYFEIDLYAQAENTYQSALNAAEASANQRAQANAYVGLALTADAFKENEKALDYLDQAEALYREIGQDALAEQVVELRAEINP